MAQPSQYTVRQVATTSGAYLSFGFVANTVYIYNGGADSIYVNFGSTSAASSAHLVVRSSQAFGPTPCPPLSGVGVRNSTSTANQNVDVLALGWDSV